jgi:hypothetical protein
MVVAIEYNPQRWCCIYPHGPERYGWVEFDANFRPTFYWGKALEPRNKVSFQVCILWQLSSWFKKYQTQYVAKYEDTDVNKDIFEQRLWGFLSRGTAWIWNDLVWCKLDNLLSYWRASSWK